MIHRCLPRERKCVGNKEFSPSVWAAEDMIASAVGGGDSDGGRYGSDMCDIWSSRK
ncbi:hypothetical protein TrVGV298_006666 [Trichoderma virens]|nr:hypothetical protein TrVGV298_006666 [Trichoderma virens]